MSDTETAGRAERMERLIRTYFEGCNEADAEKMISCFVPDAVHYFPPDMYDGPWTSARRIAEGWQAAVANLGSEASVDWPMRRQSDRHSLSVVQAMAHQRSSPSQG